MDRREFIKLSALSAMPVLLKSCVWNTDTTSLDVTVHSDMAAGHLAFGKERFEAGEMLNTKTLIVGGGIAGLSAAASLPDQDFLVCELSGQLGGSSGSSQFQGITFAQGAHYDLGYPSYYGEEVLALFEALDIIYYQPWKDQWGFKDTEYLIPFRIRNQCYENGKHRKHVLPDGQIKTDFYSLLTPYAGTMSQPTRLIAKEYQQLDQISFLNFLKQKGLSPDQSFIRALDYHMLDDYGGTSHQVSALAGIHYFMCRPYNNEVVALFSPPQGNSYFVDKLKSKLPPSQLLVNQMVKSLSDRGGFIEAEVVDIKTRKINRVRAQNVVYAGQKHALKYIYPQDYPLFNDNEYAPWMVINFIIEDAKKEFGYWQNEILVEDQSFMGFIDSNAQRKVLSENRVLTAYYCLPSPSRKDLKNVEINKQQIVNNTLTYIEHYFGRKIRGSVKKVFIKAMGHAMPIPIPGYLFRDKNPSRHHPRIVYAGVDNSRLPLLFEAVDSGIKAVELLDL